MFLEWTDERTAELRPEWTRPARFTSGTGLAALKSAAVRTLGGVTIYEFCDFFSEPASQRPVSDHSKSTSILLQDNPRVLAAGTPFKTAVSALQNNAAQEMLPRRCRPASRNAVPEAHSHSQQSCLSHWLCGLQTEPTAGGASDPGTCSFVLHVAGGHHVASTRFDPPHATLGGRVLSRQPSPGNGLPPWVMQ